MISSLIGSRFTTRLVQSGVTLALGLGLASGLWIATIPVANAKLMSASEMIEAGSAARSNGENRRQTPISHRCLRRG